MNFKCVRVSIEGTKVVELGDSLEELQTAVGGYIECTYPWDDNVTLMCNEEGKLMGLPPVALVHTEYSHDIICGTFYIIGYNKETDEFCSLTDSQLGKYTSMFKKGE